MIAMRTSNRVMAAEASEEHGMPQNGGWWRGADMVVLQISGRQFYEKWWGIMWETSGPTFGKSPLDSSHF